MWEWWKSPLQHLQKAARASSPLFQAELEGNIAAIIQQDLEPVSLVGDVYRSRLSTDVKDPLLASRIPTEDRIGRGGVRRFIHTRNRSVDDRDPIKACNNPRRPDGYAVRVATPTLPRHPR